MILIIGPPVFSYPMAPKPKKAANSEEEEGEEAVECKKCGCTEYVAVVKQTGGGKHYTVKCKKCGTEFAD
jgi:transcription elongation factor Elf1